MAVRIDGPQGSHGRAPTAAVVANRRGDVSCIAAGAAWFVLAAVLLVGDADVGQGVGQVCFLL